MSEAETDTAPSATNWVERFARIRGQVEDRLDALTPAGSGSAPRLNKAIRYSLLDGGKRLRPLVTVLTTEALGGNCALVLDTACAIEMVHTASLIIDDLPCMDDAEHRRGKQTNHLVHGEDIAILGSISMISEAFGVVARSPGLDAQLKSDILDALSRSIGVDGLCAGQERDLRDITGVTDQESLEQLQYQKTGALFVLCLEAGARIAGLGSGELEPLREFGRHAGLAFQILDDLLDALGDLETTGKDHAQDQGKYTHASIMSIEDAESRARAELEAAMQALTAVGVDEQPFAAFLDLVLQAYHAQVDREIIVPVQLRV